MQNKNSFGMDIVVTLPVTGRTEKGMGKGKMRRKKTGFKKHSGFLLLLAAAVICGCSRLQTTKTSETELEKGQRKAELQVVAITGNELTYIEAEEATECVTEKESEAAEQAETTKESAKAAEQAETTKESAKAVEQAETTKESAKAVEQAETTKESAKAAEQAETTKESAKAAAADAKTEKMKEDMEPPEGREFQMDKKASGDRERPMDMELPEGVERPTNMEQFADMASESGRNNPFVSGAETVTVYLPVSVQVHIGSGKIADFSILEAGDQLEVLFEEKENGEEVITEIWLTGTEG